jgi:hypothetical protein
MAMDGDPDAMREALDLAAREPELPGDLIGRVLERLMRAELDAGRPEYVLEALAEWSDDADGLREHGILAGLARLELGRWARAAADLERAAGSDRADLLRLAAGGWHMAGQKEKALMAFSRARKVEGLAWKYPDRLIPEGEEMQHVLGELIAAAVHGVLVQGFTKDWAALESESQKLNFLVAEKYDKTLLEAGEEEQALREVIAEGRQDQLGRAAPELLYQILNMRGLLRAAGGDYGGARRDIEAALEVKSGGGEAAANLELLSFWTYQASEQPHSVRQ